MPRPAILFTAFEPSGDHHAAAAIRALLEARPDWKVYAYGGETMAAAGAELIENTAERAVMGTDAVFEVPNHLKRMDRIRDWLDRHPILAHVPTDSPAANWGICQAVRERQPNAKVVHLVAPQMWAWGSWRIGKLRRLTDHVMCVLPFGPKWFEARGVSASFVGHPLLDADRPIAAAEPGELPEASEATPKLALLPGSRPSEIERNWMFMLDVAGVLQQRHPGLVCAAPAVAEWAAKRMHALNDSRSESRRIDVTVVVGKPEAVLDWAGSALVASGTATLLTATRHTPLVAVYNLADFWWYLQGVLRLLVPGSKALPNVISEHEFGQRVAPEFIPHWGRLRPVVEAMDAVVSDEQVRAAQLRGFHRICDLFADRAFGPAAAASIIALTEPQS